MTDDNDLVKKLRAAAKHPIMDNNCIADVFDVSDAADRIEALTEQLEDARLDAKEAEAYSVWLESKLQKTVTALQKVRDFVRDLEPYADQGHTLAPALHDACVILNELEGDWT